MAMGLKMSMKLSQQLRMTPQLQQAIKLLQLSRLELETALRKELTENPVLEEMMETHEEEVKIESKATSEDNTIEVKDASTDTSDPRKQEEYEWESYLDTGHRPPASVGGGSEEIMNYENIISSSQSLHDHLRWQVGMSGFNEEEENIVSTLISYVDDDGYIKVPFEEISKEEGIATEELEEMLPFLQEFDPPGVGARNLKECLLVQAKLIGEDTKDLVYIIENHLKDIEKKNFAGIAKAMNLSIELVGELCKIIYTMDPKPGRGYYSDDTVYVTPDVYIYKVGDQYVVSLNEDGLPRLKISNLYRNLLSEEKESAKVVIPDKLPTDAEMDSMPLDAGTEGPVHAGMVPPTPQNPQDYVQEKLRSALWLIKSIHQRQRTIFKVTESIVKHQVDFFEKGPGFIKPMILRDIANDIGMHESTVSRVTANKYVHTPRGIYELKYFFNSGISKTDGDSVASESVKLKIKDLIDKENQSDPLSDQQIVDLLKKDGIKIARRTVAKYRDVLRIQPSSKRKKYF